MYLTSFTNSRISAHMLITKRNTAASLLLLLVFTLSFTFQAKTQEVTGFNGWSIFLDPGHSQTENQGLYNYSEAEKVLRIGLFLREMLLTQTDIDTVYMSRTSDFQQVSLSQRTDFANSLAPDFYYSIHSNAAGPSTNNTLMLHGGWRSNGQTVEKTPNGGKLFGDLMITNLTAAMRIPTIGNFADRNFYQGGTVTNHSNQFPYLFVNRTTNMPSLLSEGGFHTNPYQQKRNLNADYKKLEAQAAFWSILEYNGLARPDVQILTGEVTDAETGLTLNGVTITAGDTTYVTDTYASLFSQYSLNPNELSNGFYYLEDINVPTVLVKAELEGYYSDSAQVNMINKDFTFQDFELISDVAPFVLSSNPAEGDSAFNPGTVLTVNFSRPMNRDSVEAAFSITPQVTLPISWANNNTQLRLNTDSLEFLSNYVIRIDSSAEDSSPFKHKLDGNASGESGGDFVVSFQTGQSDIIPPQVASFEPTNTVLNIVRPIIRVEFTEILNPATITEGAIRIYTGSNPDEAGELDHQIVNDISVLTYFLDANLTKNKNYTVRVAGSIEDANGNALGSDVIRSFPVGDQEASTAVTIDNFDGGLASWWVPQQSGSTTGIITEETDRSLETVIVNKLSSSTAAMKLSYGWNVDAPNKLIRQYTPNTNPKFSNTSILQAYVFGDGSRNRMRFVIRDGNNELEASSWRTITWSGWKLIEWNLATDQIIPWANGNGVVNGNSYFDSFQLEYSPGRATIGYVIFDDLQTVTYDVVTSNEGDDFSSNIPQEIRLDQNYPNPFNPTTNIQFALPEASNIELTVYDMLGRQVSELFSGRKSAGFHTVTFDASNLASGVYLYRLQIGAQVMTKKMLLLK